jgi:hypothetical protein
MKPSALIVGALIGGCIVLMVVFYIGNRASQKREPKPDTQGG